MFICPVSLLRKKPPPSNSFLHAANQTPTPTYGQISLTLNLDLRREFQWGFVVAGVLIPILGADFLRHFNLMVDIRNQCLRDGLTDRVMKGSSHFVNYPTPVSFVAAASGINDFKIRYGNSKSWYNTSH